MHCKNNRSRKNYVIIFSWLFQRLLKQFTKSLNLKKKTDKLEHSKIKSFIYQKVTTSRWNFLLIFCFLIGLHKHVKVGKIHWALFLQYVYASICILHSSKQFLKDKKMWKGKPQSGWRYLPFIYTEYIKKFLQIRKW